MRLNIFVSIEERDESKRARILSELRNLSIQPTFHGDKVEFRYYGERETVLELAMFAEEYPAHSINTWTGK